MIFIKAIGEVYNRNNKDFFVNEEKFSLNFSSIGVSKSSIVINYDENNSFTFNCKDSEYAEALVVKILRMVEGEIFDKGQIFLYSKRLEKSLIKTKPFLTHLEYKDFSYNQKTIKFVSTDLNFIEKLRNSFNDNGIEVNIEDLTTFYEISYNLLNDFSIKFYYEYFKVDRGSFLETQSTEEYLYDNYKYIFFTNDFFYRTLDIKCSSDFQFDFEFNRFNNLSFPVLIYVNNNQIIPEKLINLSQSISLTSNTKNYYEVTFQGEGKFLKQVTLNNVEVTNLNSYKIQTLVYCGVYEPNGFYDFSDFLELRSLEFSSVKDNLDLLIISNTIESIFFKESEFNNFVINSSSIKNIYIKNSTFNSFDTNGNDNILNLEISGISENNLSFYDNLLNNILAEKFPYVIIEDSSRLSIPKRKINIH